MKKLLLFIPMFLIAVMVASATTMTIISDTGTDYVIEEETWASSALVSYIHPVWDNKYTYNADWTPLKDANALWIWSTSELTLDEVAAGSNEVFRKEFNVPNCDLNSAMLYITTDNAYEVSLNGVFVGSDNDWMDVEAYDLMDNINTGTNFLRVLALNEPLAVAPHDNPAGLVYSIVIDYDCGGNGGSNNDEPTDLVDEVPSNEVPEFGVIAGAVALLAGIGIITYRRN